MFFAKILIERTPKNHLEKHPSTQNNPLVVICNEYRSSSIKVSSEKETVCVFQTKLKYARLFILLLLLLFILLLLLFFHRHSEVYKENPGIKSSKAC